MAVVYIAVFRDGLRAPAAWMRRWGAAALGLLGVTVLSTTFVQKLVLSAYADSTTAVTLPVMGVLAWKILETLAGGKADNKAKARSLAWQFAWIAVALLNLKQANLALLGLVLAGMFLVAKEDSKIRLAGVLRLLPVMVLPGLAVYSVWRYHVAVHLPGGEFLFTPVREWLIPEAFEILKVMLEVAGRKGAYFAMMTAVTVAAFLALWKYRHPFARLGVTAAASIVGFNPVLWVLYITVFRRLHALHAVSFWRFNT